MKKLAIYYSYCGESGFVSDVDYVEESDLDKRVESLEEQYEGLVVDEVTEECWYDDYTPSSTYGDYGPGNPWDAPGMSISDFI